MNNMCNIIKDILPLYAESMVSEDTRAFVDEHMKDCESCKAEFEKIKSEVPVDGNVEILPLKTIKKEMHRKRIKIILLSVLIPLSIAAVILGYLTSHQYFPYAENIVQITAYADCNGEEFLRVAFDKNVTDYSIEKTCYSDEYEQTTTYTITAWTTEFNKICGKTVSDALIRLDSNETQVFYAQNNGGDDIMIYGDSLRVNGGTVTQPRLVLGYYLIIATVLAAVLAVLVLIFRKKIKIRKVIEKLLFVPTSYIIGHICLKGFTTASYSAANDFFNILIIALPVYFVLVIVTNLIESRTNLK